MPPMILRLFAHPHVAFTVWWLTAAALLIWVTGTGVPPVPAVP